MSMMTANESINVCLVSFQMFWKKYIKWIILLQKVFCFYLRVIVTTYVVCLKQGFGNIVVTTLLGCIFGYKLGFFIRWSCPEMTYYVLGGDVKRYSLAHLDDHVIVLWKMHRNTVKSTQKLNAD